MFFRGSKRRPSRKHREDRALNGSAELHSSDKSNSQEILEGGSSAYERLKEGDNLEGWRSSPAISRSSTADMLNFASADNDNNAKHSATSDNAAPAELSEEKPPLEEKETDKNIQKGKTPIESTPIPSTPSKTDDLPYADADPPPNEAPVKADVDGGNSKLEKLDLPKLDLSGVSANSDEKVQPETKTHEPAPVSPKSIIQEEIEGNHIESPSNLMTVSPKQIHKTEPNTAVSSLANTPATSPEPKVQG